MTETVIVYLKLAETKTGEWCPTCLLPSAITFGFGMTSTDIEEPVVASQWVTVCPDCRWGLDD